MTGLEVAALWVVVAMVATLLWGWWSELRRQRRMTADLAALLKELEQEVERRRQRPRDRVICHCGTWGMRAGSRFLVDGVLHTAARCQPVDDVQE